VTKSKQLSPYQEISPGLRGRHVNDTLILRIDLASLPRSKGDLSFILQTKPEGAEIAGCNVRLSMVHPLSFYQMMVKRREREAKLADKSTDNLKSFRAKFVKPKAKKKAL